MRRSSKRGTLVIFLCLIMSAIMLVFSILLQAASLRAAENDLGRAMSAQIRSTLADFDPDCHLFGLFAYCDDAIDTAVFRDTLPPAMRGIKCEYQRLAPLTESSVLDSQIVRYMKGRLPAVYLESLVGRLLGLHQNLVQSNGESMQDVIGQALENLSASQLQTAADSLFGEAFEAIKNQLLTRIRDNYRQFAANEFGAMSDEDIANMPEQDNSFLDPQVLTQMAGQVDNLLNIATTPIYEKLCLVEYVLGQFRPAVQSMSVGGQKRDLLTIDGRRFSEMPEERQHEVEQIVTGINDARLASSAVQASLGGLRSIIHLVWILTDSGQMSELRTWATALSAALTIATSGAVIIDPEPLTYVLAAGKALDGAIADCQALSDGERVNLWPGESPVNARLYYQDYLRLFLLIQPRATMIRRVGTQLNQLLPDGCFTRLEISVSWRNGLYRLSGGYHGPVGEAG